MHIFTFPLRRTVHTAVHENVQRPERDAQNNPSLDSTRQLCVSDFTPLYLIRIFRVPKQQNFTGSISHNMSTYHAGTENETRIPK